MNFSILKKLAIYNKAVYIKPLVLFLLIVIFFSTSIVELFKSWFLVNSYYSQGLFVFIVFFWLIKKRYSIQSESTSNSYTIGSIIIIISIVTELSSNIASVNTLHFISIYLFVIGNIIFFLGKDFVVKNIELFIYLLLAIPLPGFILDLLTFKLKLFASFISGNILSIIFPATIQYGNGFQINNYYIEISSACSGLENIFGMLSLIGMLAFVQSKKKIAFIDYIIALPAAVFSNILRIVIVSIMTVYGYGYLALGTFHELIGIICFIIIFISIFLFNEFPPKKINNLKTVPLISIFKSSKYIIAYIIIMVLAVFIINLKHYSSRADISQTQFIKDSIPKEIGCWKSVDVELGAYVFKILETNDLLMREFKKTDNMGNEKTVNFYMVHSTDNRAAYLHKPDNCFKGEGYNLIEDSEILLSLDIKANRMLFSKNKKGLLVYYWYLFNGENISSYVSLQLKYFNPFNRNKNGVFIRIYRIVDLNNVKEGDNDLLEFMKEAMPHIADKLN